ncbi:MAG: outer membrane lipoprotein carrier protein [Cyclobacteriaceae bacterium]|jgi:outer membrane lipoprotein carrier protein
MNILWNSYCQDLKVEIKTKKMKNLFYLFFGLTLSLNATAQYDEDALAVLNAMSAKYKKLNAFSADFSQKLENTEVGINESFKGNITVKGNKYIIKVAGQEIFNDGTDVWSYNEEISEVTVTTYEPEEQEISIGNIYDLYKEGFKYNLVKTNIVGDRLVELDPEDKSKSYFKIKMTIGAKDELKDFTVMDKSGNTYVYSITNFQEKPDLKDEGFLFNPTKYKGIEVIDFR